MREQPKPSLENMSTFRRFYQRWLDELRQLLRQLSEAAKPPCTDGERQHLRQLVVKVMSHYEEYYRAKSAAIERDVLSVLAAPWRSSLEQSLQWIGGWRPTTVFHLVYTESSVLFECHIMDILRGHRTGDLGDLSPAQFRRVSELQCESVKAENSVTEELSEWQDSASEVGAACSDYDDKIGRLARILHRADHLRFTTLKRVVELLTSHQVLQFITAAAELHFGVRGWGSDLDRQRPTAL